MKRKSFTTAFKSKVAIEALKGHRTISELASEFGVHATQINGWKRQLLAGQMTYSANSQHDRQSTMKQKRRTSIAK